MIYIYNILQILLLPIILIFRIIKKKEDSLRIKERLGISSVVRPNGDVIWIHAVSVGEAVIALNVISWIEKVNSKCNFLLTTNTINSAKMINLRRTTKVIHQYVPSDISFIVKKFLNFWQPKLFLCIESELWPNIMRHINCPALLINAHISDKSFRFWRRYGFGLIRDALSKMNMILTQSYDDEKKYKYLGGINVITLDNIKYSAPLIKVDEAKLDVLMKQVGNRKVILAISTHKEDEDVLLKVFYKIKKDYPDVFFILVPRHPERLEEIVKSTQNFNIAVRSLNQIIADKTDLYIVDTIGEVGLMCKVAKIAFVGGSFKHGGHNILEPAKYGSLILFGPCMSNCKDVVRDFLKEKAVIQVQGVNDLYQQISYAIENPDFVDKIAKKAQNILEQKSEIANKYLDYIKYYL